MSTDVSNLIAGTPKLYIAPVGEPLPQVNALTPPSINIGTPGGNWSAVGFTMEDWTMPYSPTMQAIEVNEHAAAVKHVLVREQLRLGVMLAENDMASWSQAINTATLATVSAGAGQTAQDTFAVGDGKVAPVSLLVVGDNPEGGSRIIHIYKAVQQGEVTFTFSREHRGHQVEFEAQADPAKAAGARLFQVYDITAAASS